MINFILNRTGVYEKKLERSFCYWRSRWTDLHFFKKNAKLTLKQKIQRAKNKIKRFYVDKTLSCESHSLDEVIEYIVNRYGFAEVDKDAEEFPEEYQQMRASFIIQYAPELLGESTACPKIKERIAKRCGGLYQAKRGANAEGNGNPFDRI